MDVIDTLAGGSRRVAELRSARPVATEQSQLAYDALFDPLDDSAMSRTERLVVAAFVARLHADAPAIEHYDRLLDAQDTELAKAVVTAAGTAAAAGPYGSYPPGPLTAEDTSGPDWRVPELLADQFGERLTAALRHAHRLVYHPRDARREWLDDLTQAGWERPGIVTLSQLVSFLAYQIRVAAGLRVLTREQ